MKLLILASQLRNKPSGMGVHAFTFLKTLSTLLKERRLPELEVTAIVPDDISISFDGIEYIKLPIGKTAKAYIRAYWYLNGIRNTTRRLKPDAVLSLDGKSYGINSANFFPIIHDSCVFSEKSEYFFGKIRTAYWRREFKRSINLARKVFVPTDYVRKALLYIFPNLSQKIVQVLDVGPKMPSMPINGSEKRHFLFVGQINYRKNIHTIVKAYLFDERNLLPPVVLAGEPWGPDYKQLSVAVNELIKLHKAEKIKFLGYVSEQQKYELLSQSYALVLLSYCEGFGVPVIEASNMGIPSIVPKESPMYEILEGNCYSVSNIEDPYEIYEVFKRIVENREVVDTEKLVQIGEKRWSELHVSKVIESIISSI